MRFAVIQIGARRDYAVPAFLEKAGMLERFYTDICSDVGIGSYLQKGQSLPWAGKKMRRLAGRRLPDGVAEKTTTFAGPLLSYGLRSSFAKSRGERYREQIRWNQELGEEIANRGFGAATHIYSMCGECAPALKAAKERGLTVATEIYIILSSDAIVAEERKQFPGWEDGDSEYEKVRAESPFESEMLGNTDTAICPAEAVQEDLVRNFGYPKEKTVIVPYEVGREWLEYENKPEPGRLLFAGSACLRKGIHYLGMAAEILSKRGVRCEFRVAGDASSTVVNHPICKHLTFLGRVPRNLIQEEFEKADLLVLPTLAEGSASVTYQALGVGMPVVTTPESGSVVRDGIEGRIVASRNPEQLAEAIAELVEDRELRNKYARAAKERARDYTWERYGDRLIAALS